MRRRTPLSVEVKNSLTMLIATLLGLLCLSTVYFFIKMSSNAEHGYAMRDNQTRQAELEAENRILKQRLLETQTLSTLKSSDVVDDMIEPESTIFVPPKGPLSKRR